MEHSFKPPHIFCEKSIFLSDSKTKAASYFSVSLQLQLQLQQGAGRDGLWYPTEAESPGLQPQHQAEDLWVPGGGGGPGETNHLWRTLPACGQSQEQEYDEEQEQKLWHALPVWKLLYSRSRNGQHEQLWLHSSVQHLHGGPTWGPPSPANFLLHDQLQRQISSLWLLNSSQNWYSSQDCGLGIWCFGHFLCCVRYSQCKYRQ